MAKRKRKVVPDVMFVPGKEISDEEASELVRKGWLEKYLIRDERRFQKWMKEQKKKERRSPEFPI